MTPAPWSVGHTGSPPERAVDPWPRQLRFDFDRNGAPVTVPTGSGLFVRGAYELVQELS